MARTSTGNVRGARSFIEYQRELEAKLQEVERKLDDAARKLEPLRTGKLSANIITASSITVSRNGMTHVMLNAWPTGERPSLMPKPEAAIRQARELAELAEKERQEQERREVMAYYGDILTDEQKAAIGYDLLLEEYKRTESVESRARQYDLQQQALRLREEAELAGEILRKKLRVRMNEEEEPTFAGQVLYELAFVPKA